MKLWDTDLELADRCAARRHYKILRQAIYAPQSSEHANGMYPGMYQGCYGLSREDAKRLLRHFYIEVSWYTYLSTK